VSSSAAHFDNAIASLPPLKLFIGGQWVFHTCLQSKSLGGVALQGVRARKAEMR
jgi:hypothetical protein